MHFCRSSLRPRSFCAAARKPAALPSPTLILPATAYTLYFDCTTRGSTSTQPPTGASEHAQPSTPYAHEHPLALHFSSLSPPTPPTSTAPGQSWHQTQQRDLQVARISIRDLPTSSGHPLPKTPPTRLIPQIPSRWRQIKPHFSRLYARLSTCC